MRTRKLLSYIKHFIEHGTNNNLTEHYKIDAILISLSNGRSIDIANLICRRKAKMFSLYSWIKHNQYVLICIATADVAVPVAVATITSVRLDRRLFFFEDKNFPMADNLI